MKSHIGQMSNPLLFLISCTTAAIGSAVHYFETRLEITLPAIPEEVMGYLQAGAWCTAIITGLIAANRKKKE